VTLSDAQVGPSGKQQFGYSLMVFLGGDQQRRDASPITGIIDFGTTVEQELNNRGAPGIGRCMEGREAPRIPGLHVGAMGDQHLNGGRLACERSSNQWRGLVLIPAVDIGTRSQKALDYNDLSGSRRFKQRLARNHTDRH
jgi:hypothetical protein